MCVQGRLFLHKKQKTFLDLKTGCSPCFFYKDSLKKYCKWKIF